MRQRFEGCVSCASYGQTHWLAGPLSRAIQWTSYSALVLRAEQRFYVKRCSDSGLISAALASIQAVDLLYASGAGCAWLQNACSASSAQSANLSDPLSAH